MTHKETFLNSIKTLNAHLWLLLTLSEHAKGLFNAMPQLDGLKHEKVLPSIFHFAPAHSGKLRTTNKALSKDMVSLSTSAEAWLPAYFVVLAKSIAESICKDILEDMYASSAKAKAAIDALVKPKNYNKKDKDKVIEYLAQKITRGAFQDASSVIDVAGKLKSPATISQKLKTYADARNKLAHDLGEQYKSGPSISSNDLSAYVNALQEVVLAIA